MAFLLKYPYYVVLCKFYQVGHPVNLGASVLNILSVLFYYSNTYNYNVLLAAKLPKYILIRPLCILLETLPNCL